VHGVIAAGHPQTAAAGAEILRQGGNAVDAAVAATFASFIAEAVLVNIGGGGIAQVYTSTTKQAVVYDFFSAMPGLSPNGDQPRPTEIDFRRILVDFGPAQQPFYIGRASVAVPGVVAGLCTMAAEKGTLPLRQILAPAIRLAREGVLVSKALGYVASILTPIFTDTPAIATIYAPQGQVAKAGEKLYFPDLAGTLAKLGEQGASLFYTGAIARQILADQQAHGGLLTETDLDTYRVRKVAPIAIGYRGYTILLPPPASNGGVLIAFALKLLASISLANMTHNGFEHSRLLVEVMRLTNVARAELENNLETAAPESPEQVNRIKEFLADNNIKTYSQKLKAVLANSDLMSEPDLPKGPSNTTHISVADANGMIVGITTSAGENAGFAVGNTGVTLNNMLGEIDLHPNGFHKLPSGQRLMTMMSPVLILHQDRPVLAVGSGGSNRLRSAIMQVISNFIDFQLPLNEAVDAPRIHFEDNVVQLEGGIVPEVADELEARGYTVNRWPERNMFFGGAHAVAREVSANQANGNWVSAGDRRRGGSVIVVS
jgi:gamma-glutamyltranspeptidase/glutathione hydrolase